MSEKQDTDAFLAVRFPHLRKSWLDEINDMVGWLKQNFSGNSEMHVTWSGSVPQPARWTLSMKSMPLKKK